MRKDYRRDYVTMSIYRAAFLTLKGFTPELLFDQGKIVFSFYETDELRQANLSYLSGEALPIMLYAEYAKALNAEMRNMRKEAPSTAQRP